MGQNFRVLAPSRRPLRDGDVFAAGLLDDTYVFGRVISTAARWTAGESGGTTNLVYVFEHRSAAKEVPDREHLQADRLLVPPQLINRLGWSRGYLETLATLPFGPGEVLPVHCFEATRRAPGPRWFDDHARELPGPVPPVGVWRVGNHRTLEDRVCAALGIPLAPDD